jgi:hypothetical protein
MATVALTFAVFGALMAGMAVGVIFSNKPLKGSCGGKGGACACEDAGTPGACALPEPAPPEFKPPGAIMTLRKR